MPQRTCLGRAMHSAPTRLPDRAWSEVAISDGSCALGEDTAKGACRGHCDNILGPAVTNNLANGSVYNSESTSEAAVVIVACHAACEGIRHADFRSLGWYEKWAAPKDCAGINRVYHIPCTDGDGIWVSWADKDRCPAFPSSVFSKPLTKKAEDVGGSIFVWKRFEVPDDKCKVDWADARAHDKWCSGTSRIYHIQCERPDGTWSTECTDMPTRLFRGKAMATAPRRLPDRAWTEVAINEARCDPNFGASPTTRPPTTDPQSPLTPPPPPPTPPGPQTHPTSGEKAATPTPAPQPATTPAAPQKPPTRGEAAATPAAPTPLVCDEAKAARCKELVQGWVPWKRSERPEYRVWGEANLENLCRCTQDPPQTIRCFQEELINHRDAWWTAIELCRAH
jgi:hypothetical protein